MDEVSFRAHLINMLLITANVGIVVICCAAATIALEVHSWQANQVQAAADARSGLFTRLDSLLWKADTFLTTFATTNKSLARGLTDVRIQVKQSSDAQTQSAAAINKATTAAVQETLKVTSDVVQAVVEKPAPVVEVQSPSPTIITSPQPSLPPSVIQPTEEPKANDAAQDPPKKSKRGIRRLWPF